MISHFFTAPFRVSTQICRYVAAQALSGTLPHAGYHSAVPGAPGHSYFLHFRLPRSEMHFTESLPCPFSPSGLSALLDSSYSSLHCV